MEENTTILAKRNDLLVHCTSKENAKKIIEDGYLIGHRVIEYLLFSKVVWAFDYESDSSLLSDVKLLNRRAFDGFATKKECAIFFTLKDPDRTKEVIRTHCPSIIKYKRERIYKADRLYINIIDVVDLDTVMERIKEGIS